MICAVVYRSAGTQRTSGALTKAFLRVFPPNKEKTLLWNEATKAMSESRPFKLIPEIRFSYKVYGTDDAVIFPKTPQESTHRALLIGSKDETDLVIEFLGGKRFKYNPDHAFVLSGGKNASNRQWPTKRNIEDKLSWLAKESKPGDVVFVYYSGPCGNVGEYDYLVPLSADERIDDDIIQEKLLFPLRHTGGVYLRVLLDAPNCGSLFELPDGLHNQMTVPTGDSSQVTEAVDRKERIVSAFNEEGWMTWATRVTLQFCDMLNVIFLGGDECMQSLIKLGKTFVILVGVGSAAYVAIKNFGKEKDDPSASASPSSSPSF